MNTPARHNLDAERSLLAAMLLSKEAIGDVVETVTPDDFYTPAHGHICDAIFGLYTAGEPVDVVTVADELETVGLLNEMGGASTLLDIQGTNTPISNATKYASIVRRAADLRRLAAAGRSIVELGETAGNAEEAVTEAETLLLGLHTDRATTTRVRDSHDVLGSVLDDLEHRHETGTEMRGIPTGFTDIDRMLSGLQQSKLYVVAARPAMGKSAMALNIATSVALNPDVAGPVLFFSLEMTAEELMTRALCSEALIVADRTNNGQMTEADWTRASHAVGRLAPAPLFYSDDPAVSLAAMRAKAQRLKALHGTPALIVVDYIQLMSGRASAENRQVQVSELSRGLKVLAGELGCPVMALAQLNRNLEHRLDRRPMLADIRETGSLEQDADVVMFVYRDEVYNEDTRDRGVAEIIVAKQRGGRTGTVRLAFRGDYVRFDSMAWSPHDDESPVVDIGDWTERRADIR